MAGGGRSDGPAGGSGGGDPLQVGPAHCAYAWRALAAHFSRTAEAPPEFADATCPLFVTWNAVHARTGEKTLRGCIGSLSPRRLWAGVKDCALSAALKDRRFSPVAKHELPGLTCTVSLLTDYEAAADALDWRVGTHGIIIEFTDPHSVRRSATFLPEVAPEQGWSKEEALDALVRKSGWAGALTQQLRASIACTRYQSRKWTLSYGDFLKYGGGGGAANGHGAANGVANGGGNGCAHA